MYKILTFGFLFCSKFQVYTKYECFYGFCPLTCFNVKLANTHHQIYVLDYLGQLSGYG